MAIEDNLREFLRLNNVFAPQDMMMRPSDITPPVFGPAPPPTAMPMPEPMGRLEQLYQPESKYSDMLAELVSNIPERNKPGALRKIAASLIGLGGGPKAAEQALYAPYYQQMQDWQARFEPIQAAATQERLYNTNLRQLAQSLLQNQAADRRLDIQEGTLREREKAGEAKRVLDEKKFELSKWRAENPYGQLETHEDGYIYVVNPVSGETKNTGLKDRDLSDLEKINYGVTAAIRRIEAGSAARMREESVRQANRERLESLRTENRKRLAELRQSSGTSLESQTQLKQRYINNAERLRQSDPEAAQWIRIDPNTGFPDVKETSEMAPGFLSRLFGGAAVNEEKLEEKRKEIIEKIYETGTAQPVRKNETSTVKTTVTTPPKADPLGIR